MLRWCFWAGAWFDSGYMFQRRRTVEVPLSVHRPETGTHSVKLCKVVDNTVMAEDVFVGPVQQTTEISQLQSIDEVFDVLLVQVQQFMVHAVRSQVEIPQLQPVLLDPVVRTPLCATTVVWSMFWRSSSTVLRPCDHAATFAQWKCPRFSFRR